MNHMIRIILTALFCGLTVLSCSLKVSEHADDIRVEQQGQEVEIISSGEEFPELDMAEIEIDKLKIKSLPVIDSTNFDNFNFADKLSQAQIRFLRLDEKFNNVSDFYLNYRIVLLENFISLVMSYQKTNMNYLRY